MKEIITVKDLIKIYGGESQVKALNGVSLTVNEGDFICIMGPSGSGKSTFLNILANIDNPTKGAVLFNGESIYKMSERKVGEFRRDNIGYIFQDFNLIDTLTIRENINVPLVLANKSKAEIKERVENIAKKLNIFEFLDKFPVECSGGQRQRAAAARALVSDPRMIVADEPTGNLDTKNSHDMLKLLKERNVNDGIAIVMVTHDSMVASYAKRLLFLRDGKIDDSIDRGELTQKEFFYKIVDVTSKESQGLFDVMGD
ncbi:ABC transporter ATP-binding protein [Clostridium folliculivorans]|uniref:ABC transporter ATP-binding protein n=1 Tax=Clostridium folliculivorans TaxID=2886038 RepID=A0A9W5Y242_9CLOT|nr:ABC transporter ATP-binding protein [Clostridium folliculivorans]GKU25077.1 ABC transporter ATP-binding protein [Clostridium folliculivorans]GKU31175.1 ABC transporter ATP-binding protein [Clostridium folliculivorans]